MLGSTVLSIGRRNKLFHLYFSEFLAALVSLGVLTAESNRNGAIISRPGHSRPHLEAPSHSPNNPRRQSQHFVTLVSPGQDGWRTPFERSHPNDTQGSTAI